ncbi:MAG TPA: outer membrane beta-barrel protein [Steroidobacteraceae bacterium]|nr:outer membrane beta-barrel protein [Steroidobacteraceae bacterium]
MIRIITALSAATSLALISSNALAQDESGFYAGAAIGQFDVDLDEPDDIDDVISDFDTDDTSWKLFGGWRFNSYFALEAAYIDFGDSGEGFDAGGSSGDYTIGLNGFAPYLVGSYPFGMFEVFGKIGYYFYDLELNVDIDDLGGDVFNSDDSGEDVVYAVGLGATFLERAHARLEYEIIDIDGTDNLNAYWLSAAWRF